MLRNYIDGLGLSLSVSGDYQPHKIVTDCFAETPTAADINLSSLYTYKVRNKLLERNDL